MTKTIVYYDDTNNYDKFNEARDLLYERFADSNCWSSKEDIPSSSVYEEIDEQNKTDWIYISHILEDMFKTNHYIITGTCGRWNGSCDCGTFISSINELTNFISHLDSVRLYEQDGHFYITGYHHDGQDHYEIKQLTKKGYAYASNRDFAHDKRLHNTITKYNLFSCLPRIYTKIYGV